jgi:ribose transport system substrate-binding protein
MSKNILKFSAVLLLLTALVFTGFITSGCQKKSGKLKLAFVTNNPSNFWMIAKKGVDKAQQDLDIEVEFKIPPSGTAAEQQAIVDDLISLGVDGMAISPVSPANQTAMLNAAAAKMAVVCHDSDAPQSKRLCYVGTDNYQAGRQTGKLIKEVVPKGDIMLFVGTLDAQNARDRRQGIVDELKGSPVNVLDTRTDATDRIKAKANVEDTLVKYPKIAALVGLWSYNGPIIASAVKDARLKGKVKVICFDEDDATLQGIKDGIIYGTVVQRPFEMGYQSLRILAATLRGDKTAIPGNQSFDTGIQVIKAANVDSFWAQLKEMTKSE